MGREEIREEKYGVIKGGEKIEIQLEGQNGVKEEGEEGKEKK